jgi:hypothetical protein
MKNKPDPALLGGSYLFNEVKKRTPISRETIPLIRYVKGADRDTSFSFAVNGFIGYEFFS